MTSTRHTDSRPSHLPTDGVVTLRPLTLEDAEDHLAGEDAEMERWLSGGRSTVDTVTRYLRECVESWNSGGPTRAFAITDAPSATLAGVLEVQTEQPYLSAGQANLAYGVYPGWRRRGFGTRAVELACGYLSEKRLARQVIIRVQPGNEASAAVARRSGFISLGLRSDAPVPLVWYIRDASGV